MSEMRPVPHQLTTNTLFQATYNSWRYISLTPFFHQLEDPCQECDFLSTNSQLMTSRVANAHFQPLADPYQKFEFSPPAHNSWRHKSFPLLIHQLTHPCQKCDPTYSQLTSSSQHITHALFQPTPISWRCTSLTPSFSTDSQLKSSHIINALFPQLTAHDIMHR
jgi:hypothetical protein